MASAETPRHAARLTEDGTFLTFDAQASACFSKPKHGTSILEHALDGTTIRQARWDSLIIMRNVVSLF
jgi:hypothetical protein